MYFLTDTTLPATGVAHAASAVNATSVIVVDVVRFIVHTVCGFSLARRRVRSRSTIITITPAHHHLRNTQNLCDTTYAISSQDSSRSRLSGELPRGKVGGYALSMTNSYENGVCQKCHLEADIAFISSPYINKVHKKYVSYLTRAHVAW